MPNVVTIHGFRRKALPRHVLLGGCHRTLAAHIAEHVRPELPDYVVEDDLRKIPQLIRGVHPDNPVNLPALGGVQIELPYKIRDGDPFWETCSGEFQLDAPGSDPERLIVGLVNAALSFSLPDGSTPLSSLRK